MTDEKLKTMIGIVYRHHGTPAESNTATILNTAKTGQDTSEYGWVYKILL